MEPVPFDKWVSDNNPPRTLSYGKGWWDYIETVRQLHVPYGGDMKTTVVAVFDMRTPPPTETLHMPVFRICHPKIDCFLRLDFSGGLEEEWTLSIIRHQRHKLEFYDLFDTTNGGLPATVSGFKQEWIYNSYDNDPGCFTCTLYKEWKVHACIWICIHG